MHDGRVFQLLHIYRDRSLKEQYDSDVSDSSNPPSTLLPSLTFTRLRTFFLAAFLVEVTIILPFAIRYFAQRGAIPMEATNVRVVSNIVRGYEDVYLLRKALLNGDSTTDRPSLPEGVVTKILNEAEYWCCAKKTHRRSFNGYNMNKRLFRFGPMPGQPRRFNLDITSHDQGWSSYPADHGTRKNSWTWGEVNIIDSTGKSKLGRRLRVFTNIHADRSWRTYSVKFCENERFMKRYEQGDVLEFYCRSMFPGWCIYVRDVEMSIAYEPYPRKCPGEESSNDQT